MAVINVSLPSDGTTADVSDYNTPITTIVNEINGNLDNANIVAGAAISGSKLADAGITNAKLATGTDEPGGAWTAYIPTLSGRFVDAKWTKACAYKKVGRTVFVRVSLTASDTGPMSGGSGEAVLTLPVTAAAIPATNLPAIGNVRMLDSGTTVIVGEVEQINTTTAQIRYFAVASSLVVPTNPQGTLPFTWTTNDGIDGYFVYEAAA